MRQLPLQLPLSFPSAAMPEDGLSAPAVFTGVELCGGRTSADNQLKVTARPFCNGCVQSCWADCHRIMRLHLLSRRLQRQRRMSLHRLSAEVLGCVKAADKSDGRMELV